ncbi:MAG TPA: FeoA family protein [Thermoguttaceae bacterium]|nr:FeoA family protein [Thermoguttaceae bacterium]
MFKPADAPLAPRWALTVIDNSILLNELALGQSGHISRIVGRPDRVHQLEEFGLCNGIRVQMFRKGNPCIIRVSGNKVCVRADELARVLVNPTVAVD